MNEDLKHPLNKTLEHNNRVRGKRGSEVSERRARTVLDKDLTTGYYSRLQNTNNLLNQNEETLGAMAKAVRGENTQAEDTTEDIVRRNSETFRQIYDRINCNKERNKRTVSMFPDLETAIDIITNSTLSPNRMTEVVLNYTIGDVDLVADDAVRSEIIGLVSEEVENNYNVTGNLTEDLKDILMISGCRPRMVVSENVADDVINYDIIRGLSLESFERVVDEGIDLLTAPRMILSNVDKFNERKPEISLESVHGYIEEGSVEDAAKIFIDNITSSDFVRVTDNINTVKLSGISKKLRSNILRRSIRENSVLTTEATSRIDHLDIFRDRSRNHEDKPVVSLHDRKKATRKSLGRPMVINLPSESVCPVCTPGNNKEHIGYFVLLDLKGRPVSGELGPSTFEQLNQNLHRSGTFSTSPINDVYADLIGNGGGSTCVDVGKLHTMYESVMEKQLYDLFMDSMYGEAVDIPDINTLTFIMFSRALQGQKTTVLYVPVENLSYFALFYDDFGLGKSLLDDLGVIISIRSMLMFARVMAQLRNSIDVTTVNIELDPADQDPDETIELIKSETLKLMSNNFPLGENDPTMLLDWIQKAGVRFLAKNHPKIPEMDVSFDKSNLNYTIPDSDLEDRVAEQLFGKIGVPSEIISQAYGSDFAVEVLKRSVLYSKRTITYHSLINPEITKYVRMLVYNDEKIRDQIKEIIVRNKGLFTKDLDAELESLRDKDEDAFIDSVVDSVIETIEVKLPRLYEGDTEDIDEQFKAYVTRVEDVIDNVFTDEYFSDENTPGISEVLPFLKSVVKVDLIKSWAAENNYVPEFFSILGGNDSDYEEMKQNNKTFVTSIYKMVANVLGSISDAQVEGGKDIDYIRAKVEKAREEARDRILGDN